MIIFELIEFVFSLYISLGFGTKEFKIQMKMEKLSKEYPKIRQYYEQHQRIFETDDTLGELVLSLNLKCDVDKKHFVSLMDQRFVKTA